jgi:hypothetical protein
MITQSTAKTTLVELTLHYHHRIPYIVYHFVPGWQPDHFRVAASLAWHTVQENLPDDRLFYSIFFFEADPGLKQVGLLREVVRALRHPINDRIMHTYIVGLGRGSQLIAHNLSRLACQIAGSQAPYTIVRSMEHALETMLRDDVYPMLPPLCQLI